MTDKELHYYKKIAADGLEYGSISRSTKEELIDPLLEEIESLRSQMKEYMSPEEYDQREEDWKRLIRFANGQTEKAKHDLKQAEQERDKYKTRFKVRDEMATKYHESNTAMREALEFYADEATYDIEHLSQHGYIVIDKDGDNQAREVLSRYPKEGDTSHD